jgi:aminoglycoside phosphotransferase (APT) family kinase protein
VKSSSSTASAGFNGGQGAAETGPLLLATALDPTAMGGRLQALLGSVQVAAASLIVGNQVNRALICYELEGEPDGGRRQVFGKHFDNLTQARRVQRVLMGLWAPANGVGFNVPEPLGWLPELSLVMYRSVRGRWLAEEIASGDAEHSLAAVGSCLADLHKSSLDLDRRFEVANETTNLGLWAAIVGTTYPEFDAAVTELADRLAERLPMLALTTDVPVHKDFHYGHVIMGAKPTLLDFDEMRWGDAAFDLAHFCVYLRLLGGRLQLDLSMVKSLEQVFLQAYARSRAWTQDDRFACFSVYTCVKVAKQLCTMRGVLPRPLGTEQKRQTEMILQHGESMLSELRS